jgi:hypothetical protein
MESVSGVSSSLDAAVTLVPVYEEIIMGSEFLASTAF